MKLSHFILALSVLGWSACQGYAQHEEDFEVGVYPPSNQLRIEYDPSLFPWELPPSAWPELAGFALDDPGFVALDPNEVVPGEFELLDPAALVALRVLSVGSPEMKVWNPVGPGEPGFQISGDNLWTVGGAPFDEHPIWHVDAADPAYAPEHAPWLVTFQLVDLAEIHQPSNPVSVSFTPEPSTAALLAAAALFLRRRAPRWPGQVPSRWSSPSVPLLVALVSVSAPALAQHSGDIAVGRSAAGQVKPKPFDPDGTPCFDPALGLGVLTYYASSNSWRTDSPGFDANFEADPPHDYYPLEPGASIRLVAEADLPAAFYVKYQTQTIRLAGQYISLGSSLLHRHCIFIVDCNDPTYDPLRTLWFGTFYFDDVGSTGYTDSAPFTLRLSVLDPDQYGLGDINEDGAVDFDDINPFVAVLTDPADATVQQRCAADANLDGYVSFDDINPFVALLAGG